MVLYTQFCIHANSVRILGPLSSLGMRLALTMKFFSSANAHCRLLLASTLNNAVERYKIDGSDYM